MKIELVKDVKDAAICGAVIALIMTILMGAMIYLASTTPNNPLQVSAGFTNNPFLYILLLFLGYFIEFTIGVFVIFVCWNMFMFVLQFVKNTLLGKKENKVKKAGAP